MAETLNQRWAATIAGSLVACGVQHVVVSPGSRSTPLALAFADRPDVKCWPCIDERTASFFALGVSKATQRPAVVMCTSGTAGAHFFPAVIEAFHGATGLIAITADRPAELHGFGAPQTMEQRGVFGAYVRESVSVPEPDEGLFNHLVAVVAKAAQRANTFPRGPVHLNVPFREPLAHPDGLPGPVLSVRVPHFSLATCGVPALDLVRSAVREARRGAIVCGPRERDDGFGEAIAALGARIGFPVFAEATSNARFGFPESIWSLEAFAKSTAFRPDVVLRFGGGLTLKSSQQWLDASGARLFALSDDGFVFDPQHRAEAVFSGDVLACISALGDERSQSFEFRLKALTAQRAVERVLRSYTESLSEPAVARTLVELLPEEAQLVVSSSMPIRDLDAYAPAGTRHLRVFSNRGVNGIDGVVSTALGVASGAVRPTALLIGDVAALHDLSGWLLSRNVGVPLVAIVINNDGGGIFNFLPVAERTPHFERFFATAHSMDFALVAKLAGAAYECPSTLGQFAKVVSESFDRAGLHLIEVRTERRANVDFHRTLNAACTAAVEAV